MISGKIANVGELNKIFQRRNHKMKLSFFGFYYRFSSTCFTQMLETRHSIALRNVIIIVHGFGKNDFPSSGVYDIVVTSALMLINR